MTEQKPASRPEDPAAPSGAPGGAGPTPLKTTSDKLPEAQAVVSAPAAPASSRRRGHPFLALRRAIPRWQALLIGALGLAVCFGAWWFVTRGEPENRMLGPTVLPSPLETFKTLPSLWFDRALTRNTLVTLKRVALGFALAAVIGVPVGVLCGCFSRIAALLAPLTLVGRNIPVAALIPLTFSLFGIGELQKVMFIFIACVAFVISDTAGAIADIGSQYVDTAFTLGARRRQIVLKVLVPLALPTVFNSLRVLFGLAFGYIMLAELVKFGGEAGGLGDIIITSQRRGQREHILLVLMIIPLVALALDRLLFAIQCSLFPHRYGGAGWLWKLVCAGLHGWENVKGLFWKSAAIAPVPVDPGTTSGPRP
jgi:ABC-type nitrate/sulfonate/bicarbonate transport system permease component